MFDISHTTRIQPPPLPFKHMKDTVLGAPYALSLVFVGDTRSRTLNEKHRGKSYIPNVLSFPLSEQEGEIFINPHQAHREAKKFGMSDDGFIGYLFIHALLHLKGYDHGDTMDKVEARLTKRFNLS